MRIRLFQVLALFVLGFTFCLYSAGCAPVKLNTTPENFEMSGQKVSFCPPPADWVKSEQKTQAQPGQASDIMLKYVPNEKTNLTISSLSNWEYDSWEENREATNQFVRGVQDLILKRDQGKIFSQNEAKVDGVTALRLDFSFREGNSSMKGIQYYFIKNHTMWSISLMTPEDDLPVGKAVTTHIADTFKFL